MVIELGGSVFEITHDLVGDLFKAKNAGVTPGHYVGAAGTREGLTSIPYSRRNVWRRKKTSKVFLFLAFQIRALF
jgi:hypothetical protein